MDLETKDINGVLEPYCISIFDGKFSYSFYITEYGGSSYHLMKAALSFLLKANIISTKYLFIIFPILMGSF